MQPSTVCHTALRMSRKHNGTPENVAILWISSHYPVSDWGWAQKQLKATATKNWH